MNKKSLFFWFVAFVCAALIFTGCPQGADNDPEPTAAEKAAAELGAALGDAATVSGTTVTLTKDYTVDDAATLAVPAGVTLVVPGSKTFKVAGTLNVEEGAEVTVESGGVFFLDGTDFEEGDTNGTNNGKVIIKDGGASYSTGTLPGSGDNVVKAGGKVYFNTSPTDEDPVPIVGGGNDTAVVQLADGEFILNSAGYTLNGNAAMVRNFGIVSETLLIKSGKKLTIDIGAEIANGLYPALWIIGGGAGIDGETGSVIEVKAQEGENKFGKIVFSMNDPSPNANFYDSAGAKLTVTDNGNEGSPNNQTTVEPGTYNWDTTLGDESNASGWKAEAEGEEAT